MERLFMNRNKIKKQSSGYDVLIPVPALVYTISGLGTELSVVPGANTIVLPVLVPTPTKVTSP